MHGVVLQKKQGSSKMNGRTDKSQLTAGGGVLRQVGAVGVCPFCSASLKGRRTIRISKPRHQRSMHLLLQGHPNHGHYPLQGPPATKSYLLSKCSRGETGSWIEDVRAVKVSWNIRLIMGQQYRSAVMRRTAMNTEWILTVDFYVVVQAGTDKAFKTRRKAAISESLTVFGTGSKLC